MDGILFVCGAAVGLSAGVNGERTVSVVGMEADVPAGVVVVVVDVIRAFTTAAIAFEGGASELVCAPSVPAARGLRRDELLVGEVGGLRPAGFDFGNSPAELAGARLKGRRLIHATTNGTRGLVRASDTAALLALSAVNVAATARWIAWHHPGTPCVVVCTGRTAEDWACAYHLRDLLGGIEPNPATLIAGIEQGAAEHRQKYALLPAAERVDLTADLAFCRDVDRADFAMVGRRRGDHVLLERARASAGDGKAAG